MSDYLIIALLTLAVYYPLTLGALAVMMFFAWRRRRSPYWRLGLALLTMHLLIPGNFHEHVDEPTLHPGSFAVALILLAVGGVTAAAVS